MTRRIEKILVPVDFSACSVNALKAATEFAYLWDAKLIILHASQLPAAYVAYGEPYMEYTQTNMDEEISHAFRQLEEEVPLLRTVKYETKELISNFISAINNQVENEDIQLIIMGTKAEHDAIEKWTGTHSVDVIQSVSIPTIVIPDSFKPSDIKKMAVAVDARSIKEIDKLSLIDSIGYHENSELHVFYVAKSTEKIDFTNSSIKDIFTDYYKHGPCFFENITNENVIEGIKTYVEKNKINLLITFPRKHSFLEKLLKGSVTNKIVVNLNVPLLSIPD